MLKLLITLAILCAIPAQAAELVFHTGSMHTNATYTRDYTTTYVDVSGNPLYSTVSTVEAKYNNVNPGLGYKTDNGWTIGGYRNSYFKPTFYVAKEWMHNDTCGIVIGIGTGYKISTGHKISPIGGLVLKHRIDNTYTLNFLVLPPVARTAGVVHLAVSKEL